MKDEEIEELLRRVRPASPSLALRARILARRQPARRWPWLAAAALFALTLTLQYSAAQLRGALPGDGSSATLPGEAERISSVRELLEVSEDEARAIVVVQGIVERIVANRGEEERR